MAKKKFDKIDKNLEYIGVLNPEKFSWRDYSDKKFTVKGMPWYLKNRRALRRLPSKAKGYVRDDLWSLSHAPSSCYIAFKSDTTSMAVTVETDKEPMMMQMPAAGSNGLALYCGEPGNMRSWNVAIPKYNSKRYGKDLFNDIPKKMREFRLYLPNYCEVKSLKIGLSKGAKILKPSPARSKKPVVFYGTSITNGGCANTAGADFVSIIGRDMNIDTVNLGFSGNGRGDPEIAKLMGEIDADMYVLDYVRNVCGGIHLKNGTLKKTLPKFIDILKKARPKAPILLMSGLCFGSHDYSKEEQQNIEYCREIVMDNFLRERKKGNQNIHFVDGFSLISFNEDGAYVDNVHPTNYGFRLIADRLKPFIEMILFKDN